MGYKDIQPGNDVPNDINIIIEIPSHSNPVKYEFDEQSNFIKVDRFIPTSMSYPCNYGFIPHTLSEDGDPLDVLIVTPFPLITGIIIQGRPIGMLRMTDESGPDVKILAVPVNKITTLYQHVYKPDDLGQELLASISHFFQHYKDLEPGKWVKIGDFEGEDAAKKEILSCIKRDKKIK
ncbi:TPA: inorganic diphosphatase [Legionella pneumophila]|nr:inorganic diphosphatase [Legionella pneumophila]HAT2067342.1 inorganic diphosphatase [Legionella pneumophila]HAT8593491.1 inorganic diphosphatase [Legionella pneumophila]HAU1577562.1 inorganic diphosphatase [Legionella pneumophila]HAU1681804.1 inorganic diphosphatase [Legionella pneumophila]HAU3701260.1 inorganic diphosphatase [Legionella pneumophila]